MREIGFASSTLGLGTKFSKTMEITTAALMSLAAGANEEKKKRQADLLPLPLAWSDEDAAWDQRTCAPMKVVEEGNSEARKANKRAWGQSIVLAFNTLYETPLSLDRKDRPGTVRDLTCMPCQREVGARNTRE